MNDDHLDFSKDQQPLDVLESASEETPGTTSDTVGTGSYVAVSCSVLALVTTLVLIAGLLISRWLS